MRVKRPGIYRGSSLGRVLSYRHHLFSMPISVAYAPIGLTARNPQRRRKVEEGKKKKIKVKGREAAEGHSEKGPPLPPCRTTRHFVPQR